MRRPGDGNRARDRDPSRRRSLAQPFERSFRIRFSLASPARGALAVYDVTGRRVRTLATGALAAGAHAIDWDGRLESGAEAAAGLYYVRLRTDLHGFQRSIVKTR